MDVPKNRPSSPMDRDLVAALNDHIHQGYDLIYKQHQPAAGCDRWLAAWALIKQLARPEMAAIEDFDRAYRLDRLVFDWIYDLEMELHNAGLNQAHYHEHRIRFVRELLSRFPEVTANMELYARRAEGEALWLLGQQAQAEAVYQALVEKRPDEGWAYISWSDQYYAFRRPPIDFEAGEAILLRALARPNLRDRADVLDRLIDLYDQWEKPEAKIAPYLAELEAILAKKRPASHWKWPKLASKVFRLLAGGLRTQSAKPHKPEHEAYPD